MLEPDAVKVARPVLRGPRRSNALGLPDQLSHTLLVISAVFDDPNLVSAAGLVPLVRLAIDAGLANLAGAHLRVPTDKGASAGRTVMGAVLDAPYASRRWSRSCEASPSATCASSTQSHPGS